MEEKISENCSTNEGGAWKESHLGRLKHNSGEPKAGITCKLKVLYTELENKFFGGGKAKDSIYRKLGPNRGKIKAKKHLTEELGPNVTGNALGRLKKAKKKIYANFAFEDLGASGLQVHGRRQKNLRKNIQDLQWLETHYFGEHHGKGLTKT